MAQATSSLETRYRSGYGSLLRGDAIALAHIGYRIVEHLGGGRHRTISGQLRGEAKILRVLSSVEHKLFLVLEDGRRLGIVLTKSHADALTWEFQATGVIHW